MPSPPGEGWSRVILHSSVQGPVGLVVAPGVALVAGRPNPGGELPRPPYERVDAFPVERRCPMLSVCKVLVRNRFAGTVFAFDPLVEVDIVPPPDGGHAAEIRYRDPTSLSAAMATINAQVTELEMACRDSSVERKTRMTRAVPLEARLREVAATAERPSVARAAALGLVQGECTDAPENVKLAKQLLDTLEPTAPELGPWTDAMRRLGTLSRDPARADALVDAIIDQHPDPAVGARLLFLRLTDLPDDADPRRRQALEQELQQPRFAKTAAAAVAENLGQRHASIALRVGDPWPDVALTSVTEDPMQTAPDGRPQLIYFSASWCKACIESLPKVRRLVETHPELRLTYVLWDGPNDARDYVEQHGPIPGDVAWTDTAKREALRSRIMKYLVLPSFVLVDGEGTVLTTSDDVDVEQLERYLPSEDAEREPASG